MLIDRSRLLLRNNGRSRRCGRSRANIVCICRRAVGPKVRNQRFIFNQPAILLCVRCAGGGGHHRAYPWDACAFVQLRSFCCPAHAASNTISSPNCLKDGAAGLKGSGPPLLNSNVNRNRTQTRNPNVHNGIKCQEVMNTNEMELHL